VSNKNSETILKELKRQNIISTVAFALAVIFIGLQFWPVEYTHGMRLGLSAIFILAGLWLLAFRTLSAGEGGRASVILKWILTVIAGVGIILSIILYIVSAF
jgi:hypothetical protein